MLANEKSPAATTLSAVGGIEGLKAANALVPQIITTAAALLAFTVTFA